MHKIKVEKPKGKYRVTIEYPSGKKDIRWVDSKYSIDQICSEFMVSAAHVRWEPMR